MPSDFLKIKIISSVDELDLLQGKWEVIARNSEYVTLYGRPDLLALWWRNFANEVGRPFLLSRGFNLYGESSSPISICVIEVEASDGPLAWIPLMRVRVKPLGELTTLDCLVFLGDDIFSPSPRLVCKRGFEEKVTDEIALYLNKEKWDGIILAPIRSDDRIMNMLAMKIKNYYPQTEFDKINEVLYVKNWNRNSVLKILSRLKDVVDLETEKEGIGQFIEDIKRIGELDFCRDCLVHWDPRLRELLEIIDYSDGPAYGVLRELESSIQPERPYIMSHIVLPDRIESYQEALSKKKKHYLRVDRKKAEDLGFQFEFSRHLQQESLQKFMAMHQERHKRSAHLNHLTMNYYAELLRRLEEQNAICWLTVTDSKTAKLVLANLYFLDDYARSFEYVISGSKRERINLGDLATMQAIEEAVAKRYKNFSFRLGGENYKSRFQTEEIDLNCMMVVREASRGIKGLLPSRWSFNEG